MARFDSNESFPASAALVFGSFTDSGVLARVMQETDSLEPHVEVIPQSAHVEVRIRRGFAVELPPPLNSLAGDRLDIEEVRRWQQTGPDTYIVRIDMQVMGKPVEMHAEAKLTGPGPSVLELSGQVNAKIVFVGGMVETMAMGVIKDAFSHEAEVVRQHLSRN